MRGVRGGGGRDGREQRGAYEAVEKVGHQEEEGLGNEGERRACREEVQRRRWGWQGDAARAWAGGEAARHIECKARMAIRSTSSAIHSKQIDDIATAGPGGYFIYQY